MSAAGEHLESRESLGAYALGALPEPEAERVRGHLSDCQDCRAELEWLRAAVDALPASVAPIDPPPELKERLMATVEAEAALLRAAGEAADRPATPATRRRAWLPSPRLAAALGIAAACVAAVVIALLASGSTTRVIPARVTTAALTGRVHASVHVRGTRAQLEVTGLPAPAADHVEELWVRHGSAAPQPAGTFVVQSGSVSISRPVHSGDLVLVTTEPGRGSAQPTTAPLLVARV